ncbi:MAG: ribose-phosphate diphosphokinase [Bacteroidota bacterium]
MKTLPLLFSTDTYRYLLEDIARRGRFDIGEVFTKRFPDGEFYQRIEGDVSERNVVLVGGTVSDSDTLALYDLACALVKYGANSLNIVIPYFAYSTMERATKPGEVITAKSRARLLSSIPSAAQGNRVILMDLHSEGLPYYFEGSIVATHLYAKPVILEACRRIGGDHFVLASTDAGRAKWVESLANDLGVDAAFVFKRRLDGRRTELTAMNARVEGANVLIYDDMIRTGGSLINAARAYKQAGARAISAIATHGIFPENALDRIQNSGLFDHVVVTDTHPTAVRLKNGFLQVESVAGVFSDWLKEHL